MKIKNLNNIRLIKKLYKAIMESKQMHNTENIMMSLFKNILEEKYKQKEKRNIWENSPWKHIAELENDDVGKVGELTIQAYLTNANIPCTIDGLKTKELGGGCGDGIIKGQSVEIKTARLGSGSSCSFQHELGEKPWNAKYMLFLDIAPETMYITLFPNFTKEQYIESGTNKAVKCHPVFPTKSVCWRKKQGAFKLDTSISINEKNSYTFKWKSDENIENQIQMFGEFVDKIVVN